ncbi:ankyrin repeat domain-containing protein [Rheinheimera sp.]|uniref:ankyrin repeat domain-containing protein n=1 Tax=Rheinheimera sp. TaxID=1869214 RepID=UPI004047EA24
MKKFALFTYDFPHRKTHDFIVDLICAGVRNFVVLAAGKKLLKHNDLNTYFEKSLKFPSPRAASELCSNFNIPFIRVDHDDAERIADIVNHHSLETAIISGARIIRKEVISLFSGGVINFHPGKIPETSGLDALFYTIKNNVPAGVTCHYIDHRVDAGLEIFFDECEVSASCTLEALQENVYQLQRVALSRLLLMISEGRLATKVINRPVKNDPMTPEQKVEVMAHFSSWRAARYYKQQCELLMLSAAEGNISTIADILANFPDLLHQRNDRGWTPLIIAAYHNQQELVEFLIKKGAHVNDFGLNGTTVLMYAKTRQLNQKKGNYKLLDFLLDNGADMSRLDCYGKNVLDYVRESGDEKMIEYFTKKRSANEHD